MKRLKYLIIFSALSVLIWNIQYIWIAYQNDKKMTAYTSLLASSVQIIQKAQSIKDISSGLNLYQIAYENPPEIWSMNQLNAVGEQENALRLIAIKLKPEVVQKMLVKQLDLPAPKDLRQKIEKKLGKKYFNTLNFSI